MFIDPKGTEHTEYQRKVDGYSAIFEEAGKIKKLIVHRGRKVRVYLYLLTDNMDVLPREHEQYWSDDVGKVLASVLATA